ncbi:phage distal tail protein [Streptomyces celluloflavus]|uniref:phage distal tail protein n=1 Tax=Streptomyces celluloflavus TaxID=58344 RepID=UPI00367708CA
MSAYVRYRDLVLDHTLFGWQTLEGWEESPGLDAADALRQDQHGAWPGRMLAQPRIITLEGLSIRASDRARLGQAVAAVSRAMAITDTEHPLYVDLDDGRGPLVAYARPLRRSIPTGRIYTAGRGVIAAEGALQWSAADPRRYRETESTATTGLPEPEDGLEWGPGSEADSGPSVGPLPAPEAGLEWTYGLDWGKGGSAGTLRAVNDGDAPSDLRIEIHGPVDEPRIVQASGQMLEYDINLTSRDRLAIDTREGTVTLNGSASRLYTATRRSAPERAFTLPPGVNELSFRAKEFSPAARCVAKWRSAYW